MCSLADIHVSTGAWHFVDNICLFLHKEGVLDLSEERTVGGSGLEHHPVVEVLTYPPDPLTNTSYVREVYMSYLRSDFYTVGTMSW